MCYWCAMVFVLDQISNHSGSGGSGEVTETLKSLGREKRIESPFPWLSPTGHTYRALGAKLGAGVNTLFPHPHSNSESGVASLISFICSLKLRVIT